MQQIKLVNCINAIQKLYSQSLPISTSFKIYKLKTELDKYTDFIIEKEREAVESCEGVVKPDGSISFETSENIQKFNDLINEINSLDIAVDIEKIHLPIKDMEKITLSAADIGALQEFIEFVE